MTVSQIEKARTGQKKCWKRHLLCHTGEMIWQSMNNSHTKNFVWLGQEANPHEIINQNFLGVIRFDRMSYTLVAISHSLCHGMLNSAPEELAHNVVTYHFSTAAACLYFSLNVVFKNCKYITSVTKNVQETCQPCLLTGIFYTALSEPQKTYLSLTSLWYQQLPSQSNFIHEVIFSDKYFDLIIQGARIEQIRGSIGCVGMARGGGAPTPLYDTRISESRPLDTLYSSVSVYKYLRRTKSLLFACCFQTVRKSQNKLSIFRFWWHFFLNFQPFPGSLKTPGKHRKLYTWNP